ncbi:MAG: hypothetical protein KGM24_07050, partial [Elusimicrobia bacterium]|nr:hypothetical protein [Elusimicrobiota bacterium]
WPAARPALAAAAAAVFAAAFREIETSVLLAGPGTESFGASAYSAWMSGGLRDMSAAALVGAVLSGTGAVLVLALGRSKGNEADEKDKGERT